ncbi:AAA family ATPase [Azonexus hydrophilus]|uniref:AAA family ATPase n=1 Tax=Azonexus hydrophilus TaxID=418702 RepID=UPI00041D7D8F|nr:AAA family ATPase [Azonexus hydrophilus]
MNAPASASPETQLKIQLLGKVSLSLDGVEHGNFAYDKIRALLGYLAAAPGQWFRRDALAELLWPNASGEAARISLRRALYELRQLFETIGIDPLQANRNSIGFFPDRRVSIDLVEFIADAPGDHETTAAMQALARQAALYWGNFLEGVQVADSAEFDHWLQVRREALLQRAIGMLDRLVAWHARQGQREAAIRHVRRKLELTPWIEANYCQLMELLAEDGHYGQIWQTYLDCQRYLQREMGLEPESRTTELAQRLCREQAIPPQQPARVLQRSPLTVLACRISPPDGAASEDYFSELAAAAGSVRDVVQRHNGRFSAIHANLLIGYFGFPKAREQAAREAINAALETRACISSFSRIECRQALHRGLSLLDERYAFPDVDGGISQQAIAMLGKVQRNDIHVSPGMFEQIREHIGGQPVDDGNIRIRERRERPLTRRRALSHPLVGRRQEMHFLLECWRDAANLGIACVQITGEPGIGKSRLLQALVRQLRSRGARASTLHCLPETQHAPYQPIAAALTRMLRDDANQPQAERQARLKKRIERGPGFLADHAEVIQRLLGLPSALDAISDGQQLTGRIEDGISRLLDDMTEGEPWLLVVEDTHWCDSETLALLRRLASERWRRRRQPLLIVTTSRHPEHIGDYAPQLALAALPGEETAELARSLVNDSLDAARIADVVRRSDGVPLYVEQLLYAFDQGLAEEGIPGNLHDLLATRIDAQGRHRKLAQQAAVIGREFEPQLLAALWDDTEENLHAGLAALRSNGLITASQTLPSFRHALIRDAALQSIPNEERRRIRLRLARVLRSQFSERVNRHPELLAIHLDDGEAPETAATWLAAGHRAAGASLQQQAAHFFRNGLAALRFIGDARQARETEFHLRVGLGTALLATQGYGNAESRELLAGALALSDRLGSDIEVIRVLWGLWLGGRSTGSTEHPLALARHLEQAARGSEDPGIRLQVAYAYGNNYFWLARYDEARSHLETAIEFGRVDDGGQRIERFGENSAVPARAFLSWIEWIEGRPALALAQADAAIAEARACKHAHTLAFALTFAAVLGKHLRRPELAGQHLGELAELAQSNGLQLWQATAALVTGWVRCATGDDSGLAFIEQAAEAAHRAMSAVEATFLAFWLDALHLLGRLDEAEQLAARCMSVIVHTQDNYLIPEIRRIQGEIQLARGSAGRPTALALFGEALEQAREQGATILALRAASSLVRHSPSPDNRAILRHWLSRCDQEIDIPDLVEAKALLDQMPH